MGKRKPPRRTPHPPPPAASPAVSRLADCLSRHALAVSLALLLIASLRILSTYHVFNHTIDEPAHIACGLEWLDRHTYTQGDEQPPLARVLAALGPYLAGARSLGIKSIYQEGAMILYAGGNYDLRLALARLGILPLFWLAGLVTFWWARRCFSPLVAVTAVFFITLLPPMLAHGGLATTDMAATAFLGAAALALLRWAERPGLLGSVLLGVCLGLAVLSKFSVLGFFPAAVLTMLAWRLWSAWPGIGALIRHALRLALPLAGALVIAALVVWGGYRFSFGKVHFADLQLPAPELYRGIQTMLDHNAKGHPSYLLGQRSEFGFWYYYPVVLAVKTPLAFLALLALGILLCWRRRRESHSGLPVAFAMGILLVAVFSNINIGVRHILAVYIGFSITAAVAVTELLERGRRAKWPVAVLAVLVLWLAGASALGHPDYIAYFNEFAGERPEEILADSDLDWGQDMKRLGSRLRELGAREVTFDPFIVAHLERVHGFPPIRPGNPVTPSPGWNAVSITVWKTTRLGLYREYPGAQLWPEVWKPAERVGRGALLYYVPPASTAARGQ